MQDVVTLLLIDDRPENLDILRQVLLEYLPECQVLLADSAAEGLRIAETIALDGILSDVQMPEMDGIELCRCFKADRDTCHIPVILLTSHRLSSRHRAEGLEAGANDFISRPLDNIELVARIKTQLRLKQAEDQLRQANVQAEARLAEQANSLGLYRMALESKVDPMAAFNRDFEYILVNDAYLKYYGFRRQEILGKHAIDVIGAEAFSEKFKPRMERCFQGELIEFEAEKTFPEAGRRELYVRYTPLKGMRGRIEGGLAILRDITKRKQAERKLRESELQHKGLSRQFEALLDGIPDFLTLVSPRMKIVWGNNAVKERIENLEGRLCFQVFHCRSEPCEECPVQRALDITDLVQGQAEAVRTSHLASLGELAAGVAHEINNPMNGIINYAQIMVNKSSEGEFNRNLAERIIKEGDRVATIVRNLLSFARERKERRSPFDVEEVLSESLSLVEAQLRKDGISLEINCPQDLPQIMVLKQQIQQVFLNLLSNARYALNLKYPRADNNKILQITSETMALKAKPFLRVTFCDQGIGISEKLIDRVMNPFFSTKPHDKGTGLGLSVSHGIVSDHGGRLRVESVEGEFTRVHVELPTIQTKGIGS